MNPDARPPLPATPARAYRQRMQALGLSAPAEVVYRTLLRQPGMSTLALGQRVSGLDEPLDVLLTALQRRGLVYRAAEPAAGWEATKPEVAVELLLMERQAELNEARRVLPELQEELARDAATAADTEVQVLPADPASQLQAYLNLFEQARSSIVTLVRPPFLVAAPEAIEAARDAARRRGVHMRTVLSTEVMAWDGWQQAVAQTVAAGDKVRMLDALPFKLLMVDGSAAMLPLHADDPDGPVLRLGNTAVLTALTALFEQLWLEAVPVGDATPDDPDLAAEGDAMLKELVTMLASGANDKSAAHLLGISDRTLQRRIAVLTSQLRARTRFQAGWLAARAISR